MKSKNSDKIFGVVFILVIIGLFLYGFNLGDVDIVGGFLIATIVIGLGLVSLAIVAMRSTKSFIGDVKNIRQLTDSQRKIKKRWVIFDTTVFLVIPLIAIVGHMIFLGKFTAEALVFLILLLPIAGIRLGIRNKHKMLGLLESLLSFVLLILFIEYLFS